MKYTNPHPGRYEHSSRIRKMRDVTHAVKYTGGSSVKQEIAYSLDEAKAYAKKCREFGCENVVILQNVAGHWVELP